ncbi:hypothetical protein GJAV_G00164820 [Gymnothorax javanicus]|nr:hypothetical protein GJAV_G00164820 [Gymnothorax javanicus]
MNTHLEHPTGEANGLQMVHSSREQELAWAASAFEQLIIWKIINTLHTNALKLDHEALLLKLECNSNGIGLPSPSGFNRQLPIETT